MITRDYLTATFVFIGGMLLVVTNIKLYLMINAKLKRKSSASSTKTKTQSDSKENPKKIKAKSVVTRGSIKIYVQSNSNRRPLTEKTAIANSIKMSSQYNSKPSGEDITTKTTPVAKTNSQKIRSQYTSVQTDNKSMATTRTSTNSVNMAAQPCSMKSDMEPMDTIKSCPFQPKSQWDSRKDNTRSITLYGLKESVNKSKVCLWMTALFIISWGPYTTYNLICNFTEYEWTTNLATVFIGLASANSVFNPIIYFAKRETIRRYFLKFYIRKSLSN